mmetsp:Transcript_42229/g.106530  ORF Transcript_42229/g.106530 Transcript_42229/m.106530 type:complete len:211 (-) Transcript_42229:137-769(-)
MCVRTAPCPAWLASTARVATLCLENPFHVSSTRPPSSADANRTVRVIWLSLTCVRTPRGGSSALSLSSSSAPRVRWVITLTEKLSYRTSARTDRDPPWPATDFQHSGDTDSHASHASPSATSSRLAREQPACMRAHMRSVRNDTSWQPESTTTDERSGLADTLALLRVAMLSSSLIISLASRSSRPLSGRPCDDATDHAPGLGLLSSVSM